MSAFPPFFTDNGGPIPIEPPGVVPGDEIPRYGVWTWDGRRYQCTSCGNDLEQLRQEHKMPTAQVIPVPKLKPDVRLTPTPYVCQRCGQRITDGKPCGCGARY